MISALLGEPYFNLENVPKKNGGNSFKGYEKLFIEQLQKVAEQGGFKPVYPSPVGGRKEQLFKFIDENVENFEKKLLWEIYLKSDNIGSMMTIPFIKLPRVEQINLVLKDPSSYLSDPDVTKLVIELIESKKNPRPKNLFKK